MLADWILHGSGPLRLLPLWLARREAAYRLLLSRAGARRRSRGVAHYVVAVQSSAVRHHRREAARVRQHFVLISATNEVVRDQSLLLRARLLVALASIVVPSRSLVLSLALDVDWRLRSYPVLGGSRARLLGVTSLLGDHLSIKAMLLVAGHVATQ